MVNVISKLRNCLLPFSDDSQCEQSPEVLARKLKEHIRRLTLKLLEISDFGSCGNCDATGIRKVPIIKSSRIIRILMHKKIRILSNENKSCYMRKNKKYDFPNLCLPCVKKVLLCGKPITQLAKFGQKKKQPSRQIKALKDPMWSLYYDSFNPDV